MGGETNLTDVSLVITADVAKFRDSMASILKTTKDVTKRMSSLFEKATQASSKATQKLQKENEKNTQAKTKGILKEEQKLQKALKAMNDRSKDNYNYSKKTKKQSTSRGVEDRKLVRRESDKILKQRQSLQDSLQKMDEKSNQKKKKGNKDLNQSKKNWSSDLKGVKDNAQKILKEKQRLQDSLKAMDEKTNQKNQTKNQSKKNWSNDLKGVQAKVADRVKRIKQDNQKLQDALGNMDKRTEDSQSQFQGARKKSVRRGTLDRNFVKEQVKKQKDGQKAKAASILKEEQKLQDKLKAMDAKSKEGVSFTKKSRKQSKKNAKEEFKVVKNDAKSNVAKRKQAFTKEKARVDKLQKMYDNFLKKRESDANKLQKTNDAINKKRQANIDALIKKEAQLSKKQDIGRTNTGRVPTGKPKKVLSSAEKKNAQIAIDYAKMVERKRIALMKRELAWKRRAVKKLAVDTFKFARNSLNKIQRAGIKSAKRIIGAFRKVGSSIKDTMQGAGIMGISLFKNMAKWTVLPLAGINAIGLKFASSIEQAELVMGTFMGDMKKGGKFYNYIVEFSNVTPFTPEPLLEASKMLLGVGMTANNVKASLKTLGDIAGGSAERFRALALNFMQTKTQGKLTGRELRDFAIRGVPVLEMVGLLQVKHKY